MDCVGTSQALASVVKIIRQKLGHEKNVSPWESCSLENVSIVSLIFHTQKWILEG